MTPRYGLVIRNHGTLVAMLLCVSGRSWTAIVLSCGTRMFKPDHILRVIALEDWREA